MVLAWVMSNRIYDRDTLIVVILEFCFSVNLPLEKLAQSFCSHASGGSSSWIVSRVSWSEENDGASSYKYVYMLF